MLLRWMKVLIAFVVLPGGAWFLVDRQLKIVPGARSDDSAVSSGFYSPDYFSARTRFRKKVVEGGGQLSALAIDAKGPGGEDLTIDIGWFGSPEPRRVLLHTSGLHGVEGFAGSAIQLRFLSNKPAVENDAAVVLIHGINPWGWAWLRRVNENNVDLARNFMDSPADCRGAPELYGALNSFINPTGSEWPDLFVPKAVWLIGRHGLPALRQTIAEGQYEYPRGLFFGGKKLEQGPALVKAWIAGHLGAAERVVAVDVHTGLGKFAEDTLLVDPLNYYKLRPQFGERVKKLDPGEGPAYKVRGGFLAMVAGILRKAAPLSVGQEFGTYHSVRVLRAMRDENQAWQSGARTSPGREQRALKEAFCPEEEGWRMRVLERGAQVIVQARQLAFGGPSDPRAGSAPGASALQDRYER